MMFAALLTFVELIVIDKKTSFSGKQHGNTLQDQEAKGNAFASFSNQKHRQTM